jgi:endonuclease/exonuclease/phosphatase family metal-dependent hydrolase
MASGSSVEPISVDRVVRTLASLLTPLLISLFFLQALRLYFAQVYLVVWGALFSDPVDLTGLAAAVLMLLSLLAPLTLPLLRRLTSAGTIALASAIGISLARPLLNAGLPFQAESMASCVIIVLYGLFVPAYFEDYHPANVRRSSRGYLVSGFALALAYDMASRALGVSLDLGLQPEWLAAQVVLSLVAVAAALRTHASSEVAPARAQFKPLPSWAGALLLSGFGPLLFLEYNLFMHASTVSRWVNVSYDVMAVLIPSATAIGLLIPRFKGLQSLPAVVVQNVVILLAVACFLWHDGWVSGVLVLAAQTCIVLDLRLLFHFVSSHSFKRRPSTVVGIALSISLVASFLLTFLVTLSFAYAYTLDIFRGTEPLAFILAALALAATAVVAASRIWVPNAPPPEVPWVKQSVAALPVVLAIAGFALQPIVDPQPTEHRSLTIMTYNLHQGFGTDQKLDLEQIADTIRQSDPDVIGLQEADAGRVPSLSIDEVLWLSRRLNMHSAYGPSWGNTYGVAILSKYPIAEQRKYLLPSSEQQRACLEAKIAVGGETLTFFSVHLGLNAPERERQLDELLSYTAGAPSPKVLVGDFNAHPNSHEIGRVLEQLDNSFAQAGIGMGYTSPAENPSETIDYIFVSSDIQVVSAEVVSSLASDHLPVAARIELPSP